MGLASFTVSIRPLSSEPLNSAIALSAPSVIVTNPKPLDRPVSRSVTMATASTVPCCAKASVRSFSVVWNDRFPTNIFFDIIYLSSVRELPGLGGGDQRIIDDRLGKDASEHFNCGDSITTTLNNTLNDKIINRVRSDFNLPCHRRPRLPRRQLPQPQRCFLLRASRQRFLKPTLLPGRLLKSPACCGRGLVPVSARVHRVRQV